LFFAALRVPSAAPVQLQNVPVIPERDQQMWNPVLRPIALHIIEERMI
jgi:hypothetical protein